VSDEVPPDAFCVNEKAQECFNDVMKACGTITQRMLDGTMIVRDTICEWMGTTWEETPRSERRDWLRRAFKDSIYKACRVGEKGGVPQKTYDNMKGSIINRLVYESNGSLLPAAQANYPIKTLDVLVDTANNIPGAGSFEKKIKTAIPMCKDTVAHPHLAGLSWPLSQKEKNKGVHVPQDPHFDPNNALRLPLPNLTDVTKAKEWLANFLGVLEKWGDLPCVGDMTHATYLAVPKDKRFKQVADMLAAMKKLRESFTPAERGEKLAAAN
jgi:hypothetical protein